MGETTPRRRWRLWLAGGAAVVTAAAVAAVYHFITFSPGHLVTSSSDDGPEPGRPWFADVTAAAGIDFVHFDPATDAHRLLAAHYDRRGEPAKAAEHRRRANPPAREVR